MKTIENVVEYAPGTRATFEPLIAQAMSEPFGPQSIPYIEALIRDWFGPPPELAVLTRFSLWHPGQRDRLEANMTLLKEAIEAWPGRRGPAKGNGPRGKEKKWDSLNALMIGCRLSPSSSTPAALKKEWERTPRETMPQQGRPLSVALMSLAELFDLTGFFPNGETDELKQTARELDALERSPLSLPLDSGGE